MSVNIGDPPAGPKTPFEVWVQRALHALAQDSRNTDVSVVTDAFTLNDRDALVELYELDETAATAAEVRQVLATFIAAFSKRGQKGL